MASEFDVIKQCFQPLSSGLSPGEIGIGDDGAVMDVPEGKQLAVVTDTLVSGVHFPIDTAPADIAWKAVAVNLSDLAAMGAQAAFFSLALTLPENDADWLSGFSKGLAEIVERYRVPLIGGDTTKGPLTVTVTAHGWVDSGKAVRRSGACADDLIFVTNQIGDGAIGLKLVQDCLPQALQSGYKEEDRKRLLQALNRPQPQLDFIGILNRFASSAIDISDGVLADLSHILACSSSNAKTMLGAQIQLENVPLSKPVSSYIELTEDWSAVLAGGDDYQLCFTVRPTDSQALFESAIRQGFDVSCIGRVVSSNSGIELTQHSQRVNLEDQVGGYLHF